MSTVVAIHNFFVAIIAMWVASYTQGLYMKREGLLSAKFMIVIHNNYSQACNIIIIKNKISMIMDSLLCHVVQFSHLCTHSQ